MSENIVSAKSRISVCFFCAVLTSIQNSGLLTKYKIIDAKIAHFM